MTSPIPPPSLAPMGWDKRATAGKSHESLRILFAGPVSTQFISKTNAYRNAGR